MLYEGSYKEIKSELLCEVGLITLLLLISFLFTSGPLDISQFSEDHFENTDLCGFLLLKGNLRVEERWSLSKACTAGFKFRTSISILTLMSLDHLPECSPPSLPQTSSSDPWIFRVPLTWQKRTKEEPGGTLLPLLFHVSILEVMDTVVVVCFPIFIPP